MRSSISRRTVGGVTQSGPFTILQTPVTVSGDSQIPARAFNKFGFEVDLCTIPIGSLTAAEGYYGLDNTLNAHTIDTSGGDA
jgi:hypothetical protein